MWELKVVGMTESRRYCWRDPKKSNNRHGVESAKAVIYRENTWSETYLEAEMKTWIYINKYSFFYKYEREYFLSKPIP